MTVVVGTAGHIDHGKTTLLRALTGIDADRLPEERARGMTIDVGYAHLSLADGSEIDFVDVPGHDRLVGNMLVGAGEIDAALLVVAADDGPRAQTREHLELLDALGIDDGLIVLTKTDLVSPERVGEVVTAVREMLAPTRLATAAILATSATRRDGIAAIRDALVALRDRVVTGSGPPAAGSSGDTRLAIDRVFSIRGRGTVVTGTLRGAAIARGAQLRVVPGGPGRTVRVREVQVHGQTVERAGPGRVALNLAGGDGGDGLERGVVLTTDPAVVESDRVLVVLRPPFWSGVGVAPGLPADRTRIAIHLGTARVTAAVNRAGREAWDLDVGEATAVLRLDRPIAVAPGDRFVVRRPSPTMTLAGGRILDTSPPRGAARRRATQDRLRALAAASPGTAAFATARLDLHGLLGGPQPLLAPDVATAIDGALVEAVVARSAIGSAELIRIGVAELHGRVGSSQVTDGGSFAGTRLGRLVADRIDGLVDGGRLARDGERVRPPGVGPDGPSPQLAAAMERLVDALSTVAPPPLSAAAAVAGCSPDGIRALEAANRIVRLEDDLAWASSTYRDLAGRALAMAAAGPLTPAAYRDATGTSRKYVMAILEDLDRRAVLRRTAEGHVPGPRAAQALPGPGTGRGR